MFFNQRPEQIVYSIIAIIIGLVSHGIGHALIARLQGDNSLATATRLSINPLKHMDPLGFIFILIAGFGWAKPENYDPRNMKNPHTGPVLVALAGPFANLLLAVLCLPLFHLAIAGFGSAGTAGGFWPGVMTVIMGLLYALFRMNLGLFIFNLIPLPPLDGSYVLFGALPNLSLERKMQIYQIGTFALLAILVISAATGFDILPIGSMITRLEGWLLGIAGLS